MTKDQILAKIAELAFRHNLSGIAAEYIHRQSLIDYVNTIETGDKNLASLESLYDVALREVEQRNGTIESLQEERDMLDRASTYWWREWHVASGRERPIATDAGVNEACKRMDEQDKAIASLQGQLGDAKHGIELADSEIVGWRQQVESLQAEREKLPKTKDGVHVVPGVDRVWLSDDEPVSAPVCTHNPHAGEWVHPSNVMHCFSTRAALEASHGNTE